MRGKTAKALRSKAKDDVLIATIRDKRKPKVGEVQHVYEARKKAYLVIKRGEPRPKLHQSRRQIRLKKHEHALPAKKYQDRPMKKSGITMRIPVKKYSIPEVIKKSFKRLFKDPQNKLIIQFKHATGLKSTSERFSGIKTLEAAKKIIAKRNSENLFKATWWNGDRKPTSVLPVHANEIGN